MKAIIDTCSLVAFVRYYLPFDKDGKLRDFLERQILERNLVVIDKVAVECERQSHGLVTSALPFIKHAKYKTSTSSLIAPARFHSLIDNNFVIGSEKNRLNEAEYQLVREEYLQSADCSMILYAYSNKCTEDVTIITEETGYNNDGKVFKKIPENCKVINVKTMKLPEFLKDNYVIDFTITVTATTLF